VSEPAVASALAAAAAASAVAAFGLADRGRTRRGQRAGPPVARRRTPAPRPAARRAKADREVPQLLDLLAAAASAGMSAFSGLRAAASTLRGPLGDDLRLVFEAVDLGAPWRPELAGLVERLGLPDLRRTVAILDRTATLGTSLAEATGELAADVRHARRSATAERARAAPVKMLFPLVFLILPAFLLLTVVPVLLTTVRSIG
jgi:tight adherence protein C